MQNKVLSIASKHGFILSRSRNHFVFRHESGAVVTCSKTASDYRALRNIEALFKRASLQGPAKK